MPLLIWIALSCVESSLRTGIQHDAHRAECCLQEICHRAVFLFYDLDHVTRIDRVVGEWVDSLRAVIVIDLHFRNIRRSGNLSPHVRGHAFESPGRP